MILRNFALHTLFVLALPLAAPAATINNFTGTLDVSNWLTLGTGDSSVDVSGAPFVVTVNGDDAGAPGGDITFTATAPFAGIVMFDWSFYTLDTDAVWDPAGYIINGSTTRTTVDTVAQTQTGSSSFAVNSGDVFGFYVSSDGFGGRGALTVSNFSLSDGLAEVPEPGTSFLIGAGLVLFGGSRVRRARLSAARR